MAVLTPDMVPTAVATGGSARVNVEVAPRFKPGDRIKVTADGDELKFKVK